MPLSLLNHPATLINASPIDASSCTCRMYYAGLTVAVLYGLPGIIAAVRWW